MYDGFDSCVYLITYSGNKHPKHYIGSSYIDKIMNDRYLGSTSSKKWKNIVETEQNKNNHKYFIKIIHTTKTRKEATLIEHHLQKEMDVIKSDMFWNMSVASKNGFFGNGASGLDTSVGGKIMVTNDSKKYIYVSKDEIPEGYWKEHNWTSKTLLRKDDEFMRVNTSLIDHYLELGWTMKGATFKTIWITNGQKRLRTPTDKAIPAGWYKEGPTSGMSHGDSKCKFCSVVHGWEHQPRCKLNKDNENNEIGSMSSIDTRKVHTCPHCKRAFKTTKGGVMKRWHWDNCKMKQN